MQYYGNMGPFSPTNFKGTANINGVPMFVTKLPLTIGGLAGEDIPFGRVVSIDPTDRRHFVLGIPTGNVVKGVSMFDPSISRADPGMNNKYFAGRPCTATTLGILDINEYDISKNPPVEGSAVWCRNNDGVLAFNDGTDISASGYTRLNAYVYESYDPNGAKVFFNVPFVTTQTQETVTVGATPTATPAAGAVASGSTVTLATTTANGKIYYTLDGTAPTGQSTEYTGPLTITGAVTIKAITGATDQTSASAVLTSAYTIA